ncbi:FAD-dependent monooxygenase [Thorsellia kenyensis]|uniref:FAD-dependent monooxygenase n=1 Tax=Thorsellia kenyensis TaxID=1549888 RepID=A0ABV6CGH7_9GAMM
MSKLDTLKYDLVIVGAGMIGATQAIALSKLGLKIALIEKNHFKQHNDVLSEEPDVRISSLSKGTIDFLDSLGIFSEILKRRATPYSLLSVWEKNFTPVQFSAKEIAQDYLGFMVENDILQSSLNTLIANIINIDVFDHCEIIAINEFAYKHGVNITLKNQSSETLTIDSKLVIGADGAQSFTRKLASISSHGWDYHQSCMLLICKTDSKQNNITWQEFTPNGPRAYLPLHDDWVSLVWYDDSNTLKSLNELNLNTLKVKVMSAFPNQIGNITIFKKALFPLRRMHADHYFKGAVVLIGDAAHTINPLAGQGANIGFKDVEILTEIIAEAFQNGSMWYSNEILKIYEQKRKKENLLMQTTMDMLYFTFSNNFGPLKLLRNFAFKRIDSHILLKKILLHYAIK